MHIDLIYLYTMIIMVPLANTSITSHYPLFFVVRTFKIEFLSKLEANNSVVIYSHNAVHY